MLFKALVFWRKHLIVINGFGFANHTLYLTSKFFADKPVERLIGAGITADDLNQNLFGRNIDLIHDFDVTQFYMRLSAHTVKQLDYYTWTIEGGIASIIETRDVKLRRESCFILATNQLDESELSEEELIRKYKQDQQKVERGFRFLKGPQFLAATLYLKKPERIMALLMIMTLSLLIYATLEYRIRKALVEEDKTFPNQKKQSIQNPTARWVFQYFSGIHELKISENEILMSLLQNSKIRHSGEGRNPVNQPLANQDLWIPAKSMPE